MSTIATATPLVLRDAFTRFPLTRALLLLVPFVLILVWTFHYRDGVTWRKGEEFNYHPLFMTLALLTWNEAAAAFRSPLYPYASRLITKDAHAITHLLGVAFAIVGLTAVFKYHNEKHFKNLRSLHSWMGLLTIILVGLQWLIGSLAFYVPRESAVMTSIAPHLVRIRHAHRYAGVAIVAMSGFTAVAGTLENLTFLNVCEGEEIKGECVLGNLFGLGVAALAISTLSLFVSHAPPASPYTRVAAPATGSRVGVSLSSSSFSSEDERIGVGLLEGEEEDETREGLVYDDDDDVDDSEETG